MVDQFEQEDDRWIYGGHFTITHELNERHRFRFGADARFDQVDDTNLYLTTVGVRRETVREDSVDWLSLGAYGEWQAQWTERFRTTAGMRLDHSDFSVDASQSVNSGDDDDNIVLPSISLAYKVADQVEAYLNWGQGFHSNDVRGVVITVDPASGDPAEGVDLFGEQEGAEIGVRWESDFWLQWQPYLLLVGK